MLVFSLCTSAVFLTVIVGAALSDRRNGGRRACLCSLAAVVPLFCLGSAVLTLNALLASVVGAVCWAAHARRRWLVASCLGATAAAYAITPLPELWAWERLKKDYPLESLAGRLAHEDNARAKAAVVGGDVDPAAAERLAHLEDRVKQVGGFAADIRTRSLEKLHAGVVQQFIDSPGFGVGRMMMFAPSPRRLEHDPTVVPSIPQPSGAYTPTGMTAEPPRPAAQPDLLTPHEDNLVDFHNPIGFGYFRDRDHVAGFRPHQFHEAPQAPRQWRVARLELVGLLVDADPVVYLSANFPRMDELSRERTRPPDAFEREALAGLRRGEDLMVQEAPQQMRMLGSIRAVSQCVQCHGVARGELLGAFSYLLSPEPPAAP